MGSTKPQAAGCTCEDFLDCVPWRGKSHPKSGPHLLVETHTKEHREGSFSFCLLSLTLPGQFWSSPSLVLEATPWAFSHRLKTGRPLGILWGFRTRLGQRRHQSFGWNSYWIPGLPFGRQPLLDYPDQERWAIPINPPWTQTLTYMSSKPPFPILGPRRFLQSGPVTSKEQISTLNELCLNTQKTGTAARSTVIISWQEAVITWSPWQI